jgi:DUF2934 family protein
MIISKMLKQTKQNTAVVLQTSVSSSAMMPDTLPSQESTRIRDRAYELYELGGRQPGHDEQDWLQAEQEILKGRV